MRYVLLGLGVLALTSCLSFGEHAPGYERPIENGHCVPIVVENRQFADANIFLDNPRWRVGYASGLTTTSHQTCHLSHETASLVVDPVGGSPFHVPLPVSPVGSRVIRLTIGSTPNLSSVEIF
jgi:hypothetical protein